MNDYLEQVFARYSSFDKGAPAPVDFMSLEDEFQDLSAGEDPVPELVAATPEQQVFLDLVLGDAAPPVIALRGGGGTGKTWTLAAMARLLLPEKVLFLSVTHQARTVLEEELRRAGGLENAKTSTVAAFLHRAPLRDVAPSSTYETHFSEETDALDPSEFAVVVVDEGFMVPREDIKAILECCQNANVFPVILAGDPAQLPPVKAASYLPTLEAEHRAGRAGSVLLTKNQRAESQGLADFIEHVRQTHALPYYLTPEVTYYTNARAFVAAAAELIREGEDPLLLAWRNATVGKMMLALRTALGHPVDRAVVGEVLRVDSAFSLFSWRDVFEFLRDKGIPNAFDKAKPLLREARLHPGTLLKVLNPGRLRVFGVPWAQNMCHVQDALVEICNGPFAGIQVSVPLAELTAKLDPMAETTLFLEEAKAVAEQTRRRPRGSVPKDPRMLALLNTVADGKESLLVKRGFYDVRDEGLCFVMPSATLTVHRAQGSGRDHVFVAWDDLQGDDQDELRYVAVSRARKHLHIYRR